MRILWLHSHFLNWMGGHKYVFEVTKHLSRHHKVLVYTSTASSYALNKFKSINIPLIALNTISTNNIVYWLLFPLMIRKETNKLKKLVTDTDIIVSSFFPSHIWASQLGIPYVQICYEPLAFFYDQEFLRSYPTPIRFFFQVMKLLYAHADKKALTKADRVLTLSKHNASWISRIYGRKNIEVVYEGVDTDFYKPTTSSVLAKQYKNKQIIFHSTDFTKTKGTDILLRAIPRVRKMFPDVQVLITYTLKNLGEKVKIQVLSQKLGIKNNIKLLGFIDQKLLPAYYSLADVVVQPSRNQSMSLTVKEAMACETPIITGKEGKEQTKNGEAGFLVDINNSLELSSGIISVLLDKKQSKTMGRKGRAIIINKFSWDSVSFSIEKILEKMAGKTI